MPPLSSTLPRIAFAVGVLSACFGVVVCGAWAFGAAWLIAPFGPDSSIKANAGFGFALAGLSLVLSVPPGAPRVARVLAGMVLVLGAVTVSAYVGLDPGIDQLLFTDPSGGEFPGRMAPATAVAFVFLGSALLLLDRDSPRWGRLSEPLALLGGACGMLAFVGHLYRAPVLYRPALVTSMPPQTAVGLVLLGAGILCSRANEGRMAIITRQDVAGAMTRRLLTASVTLPLVLGAIHLYLVEGGFLNARFGAAVLTMAVGGALVAVSWTSARAIRTAHDSLEHARAAVAESEADLRQVIERARDAIAVLRNDRFWYLNPAFAEALRCPDPDGLRETHFLEFVHPDGREPAAALLGGPSGEGPVEIRMLGMSGESLDFEFSRPQRIQFGAADALLLIGRDLTERRKLHSRLLEQDRMATVGTLASGVAHEINNPLTAIIGAIELVQREVAPGDRTLDVALAAAGRVRRVVQDLYAFSIPVHHASRPLDVQDALEQALRLAANEVRHRATVVREYSPAPPVTANPATLGQIVLNLVLNASARLPEGHSDSYEIRVAVRPGMPGEVVLEVEDSGPDIAPDIASRLGTPFQTTTTAGAGAGLGLALCYRFVADLGGRIQVVPRLPHGILFRVLLPATPGAAAPEVRAVQLPEVPPPTETPQARNRVLVIDDDEAVAEILGELLALDHEVVVVHTATEALSRIESGEPYDVILCDVMMPVMSGVELHRRLEARHDSAANRVVFLTGGVTGDARTYLDGIANPVVEKPVDLRTLRALVAERVLRLAAK